MRSKQEIEAEENESGADLADGVFLFGDKYLEDGNDYKLLNNKNIIGKNIDTIEDTKKILNDLL